MIEPYYQVVRNDDPSEGGFFSDPARLLHEKLRLLRRRCWRGRARVAIGVARGSRVTSIVVRMGIKILPRTTWHT